MPFIQFSLPLLVLSGSNNKLREVAIGICLYSSPSLFYLFLSLFFHYNRFSNYFLLQKHKSSNGNEGESLITKTDIHVNDMRSYFSVSVWHKHILSTIFAGDIVLLQSKNKTLLFFVDSLCKLSKCGHVICWCRC